MRETTDNLAARIDQYQAEVARLTRRIRELEGAIRATCGRSNCNCIGAAKLKGTVATSEPRP